MVVAAADPRKIIKRSLPRRPSEGRLLLRVSSSTSDTRAAAVLIRSMADDTFSSLQ